MYTEDALFGANFDAYSMKWTGASQANPEYEAVAMEKDMRWAIPSAEGATKSVLTNFALPWWDDKGSSYARWLSHQTVQAIATIDRSKFRFNAPRHWAAEQDQWCTPKRNVHFLIVANEAGLQHYVKQDKVNKGFACASQLGNPPQRPKQLKMTMQQTSGLYPPKHYSKATNIQPHHGHLRSSQQVKSSARIFTKLNSNFAHKRSCTRTEAERNPSYRSCHWLRSM